MLGGLGVLMVGMGGFWYAMGGGHSDVTRVASGGPSMKHERALPVDNVKPKEKHRPERKPKVIVPRKERDRAENSRANAKKHRKERGPKVKKKDVPPAS